MRLNVPTATFDKLLRRQSAQGHSDAVTERFRAVWLHTDMGPSYYLTHEGEVLKDDVTLCDGIQVVGVPEVYTALVAGARTIHAPELLELLPMRSSMSIDCPRCAGNRRVEIGVDATTGTSALIVCPECAGLGWKFADVTVNSYFDGVLGSNPLEPTQEREFIRLESLDSPLQFFRAELSGPSVATAMIINTYPRVSADQRRSIAETLSAKFPDTSLAFMNYGAEGSDSITTVGAADRYLLAIVVAVFKASYGWDESDLFCVILDGEEYHVRVRFEGKTWRGSHAADAV